MTTPTAEDTRVMFARLRNLHRASSWASTAFGDITLCRECQHRWPCPTIRIIGATP